MRTFSNMSHFGEGDIIQALFLLEEPPPTQEELDKVKDKTCYPTLYSAIDVLLEDER